MLTPQVFNDLTPGPHTIRLTLEGRVWGPETVTVVAGQTSTVSAVLLPQETDPIPDDDAVPTLYIADSIIREGNSGGMNFHVTLFPASSTEVTVAWATSASGIASATPGTDYTPASGTLTFAPGDTRKTIAVSVTGDTERESQEHIIVELSNPVNAQLGRSQSLGWISDDEPPIALWIANGRVTEGDSATVSAAVPVTLRPASNTEVTVAWATSPNFFRPATEGTDYTGASGTLTFAPGETMKMISVSVTGDTDDESDEIVDVTLSNAVNAQIHERFGWVRITDDDGAASLSIHDAIDVWEGDSGSTDMEFTVTLSPASSAQVTVAWVTSSLGSAAATEGTDYTGASGSLIFAPGETMKTITVSVTGDTIDEGNEVVGVMLSSAVNANLDDNRAVTWILDDEPSPWVSIFDGHVWEGDRGLTGMEFMVTLSQASGYAVEVDWMTSDDTASGASAAAEGTDYTAASGTLTLAPGETMKSITVSVTGDTVDEDHETFKVKLIRATYAGRYPDTATGTIRDDDA